MSTIFGESGGGCRPLVRKPFANRNEEMAKRTSLSILPAKGLELACFSDADSRPEGGGGGWGELS